MSLDEDIDQNITALPQTLSLFFLSIFLFLYCTDLLIPILIMTVYSTSNKSIEDIDPLKQAGQLPLYNVQPDNAEYYHTQPQVQDAVPAKKSSAGERFHKISSKAGSPLNKAANLIGAEGWWPTTMDKECSKAARILHSFTSK